MPMYELVVETNPEAREVALRLLGGPRGKRFERLVRLREHRDAMWEGLFDMQRYVERYGGAMRDEQDRVKTAQEHLEELGVFLGQQVLGSEIVAELHRSTQQRTLLVRLSATEDDALAEAFARVPWEIARPARGQASLMERKLVVRTITSTIEAGDSTVQWMAEEPAESKGTVRVLLVFAEAPGSRPLAMRLEREKLRALFEEQILPHRTVEIDVLCHGVTRSELRERITARGGYHIVHWSGHGGHNRLELRGEAHGITGETLVAVFAEAGGFVPPLFFLSACLSGALPERSGVAGREAPHGDGTRAPATRQLRSLNDAIDPENAPGYTSTALALLRSGVSQVVAMRYSVGDDYARELAWWFYKRLLADQRRHSTERALALARADVMREGSAAARRMPVDHANPMVFGQEGHPVEVLEARSKQADALRPRPQPLLPGRGRELERPALFVGRGQALTRINRAWQPGGAAIMVVQGMAGLGKTSLAAEAVHLWFGRFDWVLAFVARPTALAVEELLRQIDFRLANASTAYRNKCERNPYERVYLEPRGKALGSDQRYEQMRTNLVEALRDEAVLLVLDNFESNLERELGEGGYACSDPHWDALLRVLTEQLPGTRSRVLMTTRHRPRALVGDGTEWLSLGPLPWAEAELYVRSHERLSPLFDEEEGHRLLDRMLEISHCHPLILDRTASLVDDREALDEALTRLGTKGGLSTLPRLAKALTEEQEEVEREYLEDVAQGSVDFLLERVSATARRLLWVVTLANEPVGEDMLAGVWAGRSQEDEMAQQLRMMLAMRDQLPESLRAQLDAMPPEVLEVLQAPAPNSIESAPVGPLLHELHQAGLVSRDEPVPSKASGGAAGTTVAFHELVRERVAAWMQVHPQDRGPRTAEQVWVSYGQRYAAAFQSLHMSGKPGARDASAEAGRRALVYLVRARDFDGLGSFASMLVTSTRDPTLLGAIVAELRAVAEQVPAGQVRWRVRTYLADALGSAGRPDEALPLYQLAVDEAEQAEHWSDVAWVCGSWANALRDVGQLDASKATHLRSAEASRKAGHPHVNVVGSELEALRTDVMQGHAAQALPDIEARLSMVRGWWETHAQGPPIPEAPSREVMGRALVSGLDIAHEANRTLARWQDCLDLLKETERTQEALGESEQALAATRFNQCGPLLALGRLDEAQRVLEHSLAVFRKAGNLTYESMVLTGLAVLWKERGDLRQAAGLGRQALAVRNRLPNPEDRTISHNNLANYLDRFGQVEQAAAHRLAALGYILVTGQRNQLSVILKNLAIAKRRAAAAGTIYDLPRLADLLAQSAFDPLRRFVADRDVDLDKLQAAIDHLEVLMTQKALANRVASLPTSPIRTTKSVAATIAILFGLLAAAWMWFFS